MVPKQDKWGPKTTIKIWGDGVGYGDNSRGEQQLNKDLLLILSEYKPNQQYYKIMLAEILDHFFIFKFLSV